MSRSEARGDPLPFPVLPLPVLVLPVRGGSLHGVPGGGSRVPRGSGSDRLRTATTGEPWFRLGFGDHVSFGSIFSGILSSLAHSNLGLTRCAVDPGCVGSISSCDLFGYHALSTDGYRIYIEIYVID